jgi:hypothetical protein
MSTNPSIGGIPAPGIMPEEGLDRGHAGLVMET